MGITLDQKQLQAALERALARIDRGEEPPAEWVQRTEHIGTSPSKTYVAGFGTALLARAAYGNQIDPMSVQAKSGPRGYSARGTVKVLVANAASYGYHLGVTKAEPLNNQPYFRTERLDDVRVDSVRKDAQPYFRALKAYLKELDKLDAEAAERALAAFLSVRQTAAQAADAEVGKLAATAEVPLARLAEAAQSFARADPEMGKRGQALVAAALDCVFPRVELGGIHDPDALDVAAWRRRKDERAALGAQVKQKGVDEAAAIELGREAGKAGVATGLLVAIAPDQRLLNQEEIAHALRDLNVAVVAVENVPGLFNALTVFSGSSPAEIAAAFPGFYLTRLQEIEARPDSVVAWEELVDEIAG